MAAAEKISVSLGAEDLSWARQRAKREVKSLSAVVSEALRRQRQAEARTRLLAELGTDDITERERDQVRDEWRMPHKKGRKRKKKS
jgi:Arc/MetJ-type ribon-helix-helix transcriptional regulator